MKVKKFFSAILSAAASAFPVNAEENETHCCPCNLVETDDYTQLPFYEGNNVRPTTYALLPPSVDLSETIYFPEIGDQGGLGACVAFATTYYQYSYEVNRLNGITSESQRVVYSPKWTFNILSGGTNEAIDKTYVYSLLESIGALKNEDFTYNGVDYTSLPTGMEAEKIEALKTRLESVGTLSLPSSGTFITSASDTDLYGIKSALNDGKVLTVSTMFSFNIKYGYGIYDDQHIAYRCFTPEGNSGHAITVVGYDDNISCDVNGNGIIEECEKGAFKIANSWGTDYANDGYIWILYDAINPISANTVNNWESTLSGTRWQALCTNSSPIFTYIDVAHKDLYYIGEVYMNTNYFNRTIIKKSRTSSIYAVSDSISIPPFNSIINYRSALRPFDGIFLFDYGTLCSPINYYLWGYIWKASINLIGSSSSLFRIIDDKGHEIVGYEDEDSEMAASSEKTKIINTKFGDVDYDGILTQNDYSLIQQYLVKSYSLSTLQKVLADYNQDGTINIADSTAILADKEA